MSDWERFVETIELMAERHFTGGIWAVERPQPVANNDNEANQ